MRRLSAALVDMVRQTMARNSVLPAKECNAERSYFAVGFAQSELHDISNVFCIFMMSPNSFHEPPSPSCTR